MKLELATLMLAALTLQTVHAAPQGGWYLKVEVPQVRNSPPKPTITVADRPTSPRFDPLSGKWLVPLDKGDTQFVVSYVVGGGNEIIAVRIDVPTRIVREHQSVFLGPPSLKVVDEKTIRNLWNTNQITSDPSNTKQQFRYLQDLLYANQEFMNRQNNSIGVNFSAKFRSSFMLLQVVRNLAQHTWYVVDHKSQAIIDWSEEVVRAGDASGNSCNILRICKTRDIPVLLSTVRSINSHHINRMYAALVPDGAELNTDFCSMQHMLSLNSFLQYLRASADQNTHRTGVNESRVVNDIAACHAVRALCIPASNDASIAELQIAEQLLLSVNQSSASKARLRDIRNAITDLKNKNPAICPTRS